MAGGQTSPPAISLCRALCGAIWTMMALYIIFCLVPVGGYLSGVSACVCQKPTLAIIKAEVK